MSKAKTKDVVFLILVVVIIAAAWAYLAYTNNQMLHSTEDAFSTQLAATMQYFDATETAIFSH